jgi:hypothetical protein
VKINLAALLVLGAISGEPKVLEVKFSVNDAGGHAMLHVALDNRMPVAVNVPRALAAEEEMYGKLFDIRDTETGQPLQYQGIMVKRGPLTEDDYVIMPPGSLRNNTIDLSRDYVFKAGRHAYSISYAGQYLMDGKEMPLTEGPVHFEFTGR